MHEALTNKGYQRLTAAILKQALYDYAKSHRELIREEPDEAKKMRHQKASIIRWVNDSNGTFQMCAHSWGLSEEQLRNKFKKFFQRIRRGGDVKVFSINNVYE